MNPTTIYRARFFRGFGVEELPVILDEDGTVLVWDRVASHYTRVHALSARTCRRIQAEILRQGGDRVVRIGVAALGGAR